MFSPFPYQYTIPILRVNGELARDMNVHFPNDMFELILKAVSLIVFPKYKFKTLIELNFFSNFLWWNDCNSYVNRKTQIDFFFYNLIIKINLQLSLVRQILLVKNQITKIILKNIRRDASITWLYTSKQSLHKMYTDMYVI